MAMQTESGIAGSQTTAESAKDAAKRVSETARHKAVDKADDTKRMVARELEGLADTLEGRGTQDLEHSEIYGRISDSAVQLLRRASNTINEKSTDEILEIVNREARNRPELVIGGCLALGFLGARLFRI